MRIIFYVSRMPHQLPNPAEDHCLLRVVLSDFLAFLTQLLSHGHYMCYQVSIFRLRLLKLFLVCLLRHLPEDISGSAVV